MKFEFENNKNNKKISELQLHNDNLIKEIIELKNIVKVPRLHYKIIEQSDL